jgi:glycosyltransferase involved in cell wall biosynthesis
MRKIVVLSHRDIKHREAGGANLYVHEICKRLSNRYDFTILSTVQGELPSTETLDGIKIVRVPFPRLCRLSIPASLILGLAGRADLIIDNGDVGVPWLSPLFTRTPKIALIYQVAGDIFRYELERPLSDIAIRMEPWVYRVYRGSRIITCSPSTKEDLVKSGLPPKNITVIRPGLEDSFLKFQSSDRKFDDPTVVCISRFKRYKGLEFAIVAMKRVLEKLPSSRLIIVGNGDSSELERVLSNVDYRKSIKIIKRAPDTWNEEKRTLLSRSHVLLVPSVREGYGIVIIEANACGTPAIGWAVRGVRDSILDGKTGLLVPFGDVDALATALIKCLSEYQIMEDLSRSGIDWARQHSWDTAAEMFAETIDSEN